MTIKIAICSDVHLEFGDINLQNTENADILILSGDIMVASDLGKPDPHNFMEGGRSTRFVDFFKRCSFQFPHVIYVMGNHEHYHGDFATSATKIREMLKANNLDNVHFLDNEVWDYGTDYRFVGGTLWTDMNKEDPLTLYEISHMMNDFRIVQNSNREVNYKTFEKINGVDDRTKPVFHTRPAKFSPEDAVVDHKAMLSVLNKTLEDTPPWTSVIVVGHHAPSKQSTHPRYKDETLMNGGYSSDLSDFILDHPEIKLWTHGHTHEDFDYMIASTRIVCNPRGYINYEDRADRFELKVVEV
jgi:DNA repair exonuclease SbcCD nuclease subunit